MAQEQLTAWQGEADPVTGTARISGELDFTNTLAVRDWLKTLCDESKGDITIDLEHLGYIDSSGLAILIEIRKYLGAQKRMIRISKVSPQVHKLFVLTQIGELFGI